MNPDVTLFDDQKEWSRSTVRAFEEGDGEQGPFQRVLSVAATGAGKTIMGAGISYYALKRWEPPKVLFLADTDELIGQAQEKIHWATNIPTDREKGRDSASLKSRIVVGSIQTLQKPARLNRYPQNHFGLVIADECFVAGTLVDGRPIESIVPGDMVTAFDHITGQPVKRKVIATSKTKAKSLVTLKTSDGKSFNSTANHPVFASGAYKDCAKLTHGENLVTLLHADIEVHQLRSDFHGQEFKIDMLGSLHEGEAKEAGRNDQTMSDLRKSSGERRVQSGDVLPREKCLLFDGMRSRSHQAVMLSASAVGELQSGVCFGPHEAEKSHARSGHSGENGQIVEENRPWTKYQWRQWDRADYLRSRIGRSLGSFPEFDRHDQDEERNGVSVTLQDRPWIRRFEARNRSGWRQSQCDGTTATGCEETGILGVDWVDSVEVHEPGSDGRFGGMCPDGYVYNLEIEGESNYFANGILVHNCHLSMADGWQRVLNHFDEGGARSLGITATPFRGDDKNLWDWWQFKGAEIGLFELIEKGRLSPIRVKTVPLDIEAHFDADPDAEDIDDEQVRHAIEPAFDAIIDAWEQHGEGRKTLWFLPGCQASQRFTQKLLDRGHTAAHVDGTSKNRKEILAGYASNRFKHLCNADLLMKGYDQPDIECVVILKLTKSRVNYQQMIGRGTRVFKGKTDMLLLDFLYQFGDLGVCRPGDLIARNPRQAREIQDRLNKGQPLDLREARDLSESEAVQRLVKGLLSRRGRRGETYDARDAAAVLNAPELLVYEPEQRWELLPPTPRQLEILARKGLDPKSIKTRGEASNLMTFLIARAEKDRATLKQVVTLGRLGVQHAENMSFAEASAMMDLQFSR